MGNRRLTAIRATYGSNKTNLNPQSNAEFFEYKHTQKKAGQAKRIWTHMMRNVRRATKKLNKVKQKDWLRARRAAFGYWYYWIREGKIGIETDEKLEPDLLHG